MDQDQLQAHANEVLRIADAVSQLIRDEPHNQGIDAVLHVFKILALKHQCCTRGAAHVCAHTAGVLLRAAEEPNAAGQQVH